MHTIQFDANTEQRLSRLAALEGKDPDQLICEALAEYLQDLEDAREAEAALERIERGDETTIPWEAIKAEHGL